MSKDILKKWYFWAIIFIIIPILLIIVLVRIKDVGNVPVSSNVIQQESISYKVLRNIYEDGGKKKTEKIVITNKNISNDEIEEIYKERKEQNKDVDLTIWLFSNEDDANNMNNAEVAEASYLENEGIKINNYEAERVAQEKAEKEEAERKQQEEEQKAREEQEKQEQEQKQQQIEQEKQEFKDSCNTYTYEQLARNPAEMIGTRVKLVGEVIQTMYDGNIIQLRVNITKENGENLGIYSIAMYPEELYSEYSRLGYDETGIFHKKLTIKHDKDILDGGGIVTLTTSLEATVTCDRKYIELTQKDAYTWQAVIPNQLSVFDFTATTKDESVTCKVTSYSKDSDTE